jgi:anti-sigma regulatory factor (Ser/Thr protein kinase)
MNSIKLNVDIDELYKINEFINGIILKEDFHVELIVEEVFVNIVNYSNSDFVNVKVDYDEPTLTIEFIDNGVKFNPLLKENPEFPSNIDDAQIGGLGIFFAKQMADDLSYEYLNGENHLKIIKNVA